jgi:glucan phosphorylase
MFDRGEKNIGGALLCGVLYNNNNITKLAKELLAYGADIDNIEARCHAAWDCR